MHKTWAAQPQRHHFRPPCKNTRPFAFTSRTLQKPIKSNLKLPLLQLDYSLNNNYPSHCQHTFKATFSQSLFLSTFSLILLILRLTSGILLPDFSHRWSQLIYFSTQAEAELIKAPKFLFQAVVAYEDRRFFRHFGVDTIGVARAVLSLSDRGGGSTITQQLVKNTFLKNERTLLRKFVEMVLAVALERRISKRRILSAYLCKVKHNSLLGKTFQARVLKRMVVRHFLDIGTALSAMRKPLPLKSDGLDDAKACCFNVLLRKGNWMFIPSNILLRIGLKMPRRLESGTFSTMKDIWDWERESKICEVIEEMETWAMSFRKTKEFVKPSDRTIKQLLS
ncbi:hypothetical protein DH2020_007098 [Rehmannia glutinosa]|uniref:Glycosyl transferase family 51 domain-containing protein n=1 Tax=Rehmannia glutinosa TaxID=99300 RepID=A0ABR0TWZ6_REHGL